jgi:hypothetical protein
MTQALFTICEGLNAPVAENVARNWNLLDEVAESLTANRETSLTPRTADV